MRTFLILCFLAVFLTVNGFTLPRQLGNNLMRWQSLRLQAEENAEQTINSESSPAKAQSRTTVNRKSWDMSKCIYCGNLPQTTTEEGFKTFIHEHIGPERLESIRLIQDKKTGTAKGYAYINFKDAEDAQHSITELSALQFEGNPLKVTPRIVRTAEEVQQDLANRPRLYFANLAWTMTEEDLRKLVEDTLQKTGEIKYVKIPKDDFGRSKGFAFVELRSPELVDTVIEKLNGHPGEFKPLKVERSSVSSAKKNQVQGQFGGISEEGSEQPQQQQQPQQNRVTRQPWRYPKKDTTVSVFLGNLSWSVTQELLEEMLTDVLGSGSFLQIRVAKDPTTGNHRGFAHIDFKDAETAEHAIKELNGIELLDRVLRADRAERAPGSRRPTTTTSEESSTN